MVSLSINVRFHFDVTVCGGSAASLQQSSFLKSRWFFSSSGSFHTEIPEICASEIQLRGEP